MKPTGTPAGGDIPICPDCHVHPGQPHADGCDVARCTACGWQRITCRHGGSDIGWGQIWTGRWPGSDEVTELGLRDLNELGVLALTGNLTWNPTTQKWERPKGDAIPMKPDSTVTVHRSVTAHATDPKHGMTLDELAKFVQEAMRAGIPGGTTVKMTATWRSSIKRISCAGVIGQEPAHG